MLASIQRPSKLNTKVVPPCKMLSELRHFTYVEGVQTVKGENSDLFINGHKIHVQTEDWGPEQKVLVSRVYKNGSVHKTFKLQYEKISQVEKSEIRLAAVKRLHQMVIDWTRKEI